MRRVQLLPAGPDAVLVEVGSASEAVDLATWARDRGLARDVVPGAETVLLDGLREGLGDAGADGGRLDALLAGWRPSAAPAGAEVEIPVRYDGPDLGAVAEHWGCEVEEVVRRHQETTFVSAFCGFAPGFAYLSGLAHDVPRLTTPRTRVPAGSVALAGRWCGVYPGESPGGWRLLGTTDAVLWDAGREHPALLAPGTRVSFVAVG